MGGIDLPSNIIFICEKCHDKIHMIKRFSISESTIRGLKRARRAGVKLGAPRKFDGRVYKIVLKLRNKKYSIRNIAKKTRMSSSNVFLIIKKLK